MVGARVSPIAPPRAPTPRPPTRHPHRTCHTHTETVAARGERPRGEKGGGPTPRGPDPTRAPSLSLLSSALHGLLRKLGGFADPGGASGRVRALAAALRGPDPSERAAALAGLCDALAVASEDALAGAPIESLVPSLVAELSGDSGGGDGPLLAARALTHLADALPPATAAIVRHGGLPALIERLMMPEYVDLAEQCLACLGLVAAAHPRAAARAGGLAAALAHIDFFQTGVQRAAAATAAAIARGLTPDCAEPAAAALPMLVGLLCSPDARVAEAGATALARVAALAPEDEVLGAAIDGSGVAATAAARLALAPGGAPASGTGAGTYFSVLRLLTALAAARAECAAAAVGAGALESVAALLGGSPLVARGDRSGAPPPSSSALLRSADQLATALDAAASLLPPLLDPASAVGCGAKAGAPAAGGGAAARAAWFAAHPAAAASAAHLLPPLIAAYDAAAGVEARAACVDAVSRAVAVAPPAALTAALADAPASSLVASLLRARDGRVVAAGVMLAELLAERLPRGAGVGAAFAREGVLAALAALAAPPAPSAAASPAPSSAGPRASARLRGRTRSSSSGGGGERGTPAADADAPPAPTPPPSTGATAAGVRAAAAARAALFLAATFPGAADGDAETDAARALRAAAAGLATPEAAAALHALLDAVDARVSPHELRTAGVPRALRAYVSGADLLPPPPRATGSARGGSATGQATPFSPAAVAALRDRCLALLAAGAAPRAPGGPPRLRALVRSLHDVVNAADRYAVATPAAPPTPGSARAGSSGGGFPFGAGGSPFSGQPSTPGSAPPGSLGAGLAALAQPLKLRLVRAPGSRLRDAGASVVLVEPLASVAAVADFLWPRVAPPPPSPRADGGGGGGGGSGRGRGASASAPAPTPSARRPAPSRDRPIPRGAGAADRRVTRAAARAAGGDVVMGGASSDEGGGAGGSARGGRHGAADDDAMASSSDGGDDGAPFAFDGDGGGSGSESMSEDDEDEEEGRAAPSSYAAAAAAGGAASRLRVTCCGVPLDPDATVLQALTAAAVASAAARGDDDADAGRRLWADVHTLTYDEAGAGSGDGGSGGGSDGGGSVRGSAPPSVLPWPLCDAADQPAPALRLSPDGADALAVLAALDALNRGGGALTAAARVAAGAPPDGAPLPPPLDRADFVNPRLAPKLALALKDVLGVAGGALPPWASALVRSSPFLFPAPLRARYVRLTAFGLSRALAHMADVATADAAVGGGAPPGDDDARLGRLARARVRVDRARVIDTVDRVLAQVAGLGGGGGGERAERARGGGANGGPPLLEVEFAGEPGTGLGPTLEWYTLASHGLTAPGLGMWRGDGAAPGAGGGGAARGRRAGAPPPPPIDAPLGLFPAPLATGDDSPAAAAVLARFSTLGGLAGRALRDGRLVDLRLAPPFWRAVRGRALGLHDVGRLDAGLGRTLEALAAAASAAARGAPALLFGTPLADAGLTWDTPGFPAVPLPGGAAGAPVDASTVGAFVVAVVDATVGAGVSRQVTAFRDGFSKAAPLSALAPFDDAETDALLCGEPGGGDWSPAALEAAIRFDHGYTAASAPARHFVAALAGLDPADRARFLRFATGCPRLPHGGLAALAPRLTVVRKHASARASDAGAASATPPGSALADAAAAAAADADLPSVMTCANYVKLPPYSSAKVAAARLLYAVREGQGAFDLS